MPDLMNLCRFAEILHQHRDTTQDALRKALSALDGLSGVNSTELVSFIEEVRHLHYRTGFVHKEDSQEEEDTILRQLLPKDPIVYVDVGAGEPIYSSNTWQFYKAGGRGVLIEPLPIHWHALLTQRPRDHLWPTACCDHDGHAKLRCCYMTSSIDSTWPLGERSELLVEVHDLNYILNHYPDIRDHDPIHLCSIDVEGAERCVLRGIPWKTFRPLVIVVEHREWGVETHSPCTRTAEWEFLLTDHGYALAGETKLNRIYKRLDYTP
jgi:FkbM family methyltransferase